MLRIFFALLPIIANYETVTNLSRFTFRVSLVNVSLFACTSMLLAIRHWLTNPKPINFHGRNQAPEARSR